MLFPQSGRNMGLEHNVDQFFFLFYTCVLTCWTTETPQTKSGFWKRWKWLRGHSSRTIAWRNYKIRTRLLHIILTQCLLSKSANVKHNREAQHKMASLIYVCKVKVTCKKKKRPTVAASLMLIACLVVEIINTNAEFLPLTLHQGQGHQNKHEHISHAWVYCHAKFQYSLILSEILL